MKRPWPPRGVAEPGYFSLVHRRDSRYASCRLAFAAAKWRKTCRKSLSRGLRFASLAPVRDFGITSESFPTKASYPGKFSAFRALCRTRVLFLRIMSESFPLKQMFVRLGRFRRPCVRIEGDEMQFRLAQLFLTISTCAVFLAMRYWWVTSEDNRIAIATPIVTSTFCGALLGASRRPGIAIVALSGFVGLIAAVALTLESYSHPSTSHCQHSLASDWSIIVIVLLVFTFLSTAAGGLAWLATRLLRSFVTAMIGGGTPEPSAAAEGFEDPSRHTIDEPSDATERSTAG